MWTAFFHDKLINKTNHSYTHPVTKKITIKYLEKSKDYTLLVDKKGVDYYNGRVEKYYRLPTDLDYKLSKIKIY